MDRLPGDITPAGTAQIPHHGGNVLGLAACSGVGAVVRMGAGVGDVAGRGVSIAPGTIQLAVILCVARSCARARENPTSAALAVITCARSFEPICALMPPILMMLPPFFFNAGRHACTQRKLPSRMTPMTSRQSA